MSIIEELNKGTLIEKALLICLLLVIFIALSRTL